ncbi:MAG: hypothetical protein WC718_00180 [Phycisphaerales bacterium]
MPDDIRPPSETGYPQPDRNEQPVFGWPMVIRPATAHPFKGVVKDANTITILEGYLLAWVGANPGSLTVHEVVEADVPVGAAGKIYGVFQFASQLTSEFEITDDDGDKHWVYNNRISASTFVEYTTTLPAMGATYTPPGGGAFTEGVLYVPILEFGQAGGSLAILKQFVHSGISFSESYASS